MGNRYRRNKVMRTVCSLLLAFVSVAWVDIPAPAEAFTVYVSNEKDNTISIIDGNSYEVTATVPVGQRPRGPFLGPGRRIQEGDLETGRPFTGCGHCCSIV